MLLDLEVCSLEAEIILRAVDYLYTSRKCTYNFIDDVDKIQKMLKKFDLYITETGGSFSTRAGKFQEELEGGLLDGLEPYFATAQKVEYVGGTTFELVNFNQIGG